MLKVNMISESAFTVQGHGVHTAFSQTTAALLSSGDVDVVVNKFRRGADITHIHTLGIYSLMHLVFGSGKKVVSVHVVPDSFIGSVIGARRFYKLAEGYMRFFYNRADVLLSVSNTVDETLRTQLGVKTKSHVLYNTVDMATFASSPADREAARKALNVPADQQVVISCAQIQPRKRFDLFCDAARALPDVHFVWIGGMPFKQLGADYKSMQQLLDNKPANVMTTGVIEHSEVKRYLHAADVFFLPSEQENHPMAVLEAAGVGLPILLRDIPEYNDTFGDDVIRGNDETFVTLLGKLKDDPAFYKQGQAGAKKIAERFGSAKGAQQLIAIYKKLSGQ